MTGWLILCLPIAASAAEGLRERVGGRGELVQRLSHLEGADGSLPEVWFDEPADDRALRFVIESSQTPAGRPVAVVVSAAMASAPCRLGLSRDPDLTWVIEGGAGCRSLPVAPAPQEDLAPVAPAPRMLAKRPWLSASLGPAVGNRGGGGMMRLSGGAAWQRGVVEIEAGGRIWGAAELAPDRRYVAGVDAILRAGEGGYVELGAGVAGLRESRVRCADCEIERVGALGPSLSGAVGLRGRVASESLELLAALGGRSLPDRRFQLGLTLGLKWTRP